VNPQQEEIRLSGKAAELTSRRFFRRAAVLNAPPIPEAAQIETISMEIALERHLSFRTAYRFSAKTRYYRTITNSIPSFC
jgi:hypothetical protein